MSPRRVVVGLAPDSSRDAIIATVVAMGYDVTVADSSEELLRLASSTAPQLLLVDQAFVQLAEADCMAQIHSRLSSTPVILLPAGIQARTPVNPDGSEPISAPELMVAVERVLGASRSAAAASHAPRKRSPFDPFVGQSPEIRRLAEEALKALASESPILIEGETGTGKGVLASWLHRHGSRAQEPFVDLNCAGFSRELMDSELFGHDKGAFTGAVGSKAGLLEVADKGMLFLDEIGDMELAIQAKLLKVIEEKRFRRIGDTRERHIDVRIIAATHHDLYQRVQEGLFREDLYFRLCVLPMRIAPLRDRAEDVPALARRLITLLAADGGEPEWLLSSAAEALLKAYPWPGNVRDLRNVLERSILHCDGRVLESEHLRFESRSSRTDRPPVSPTVPAGPSASRTLVELERDIIVRVLEEEGNDKENAAKRLGIPRSTFYQKLASMGITARR